MTQILQSLLVVSVFAFALTSMLSVGLGYTARQIVEPLRQPTAVLRAVVANFVVVPLVAVAITRLLPLRPGVAMGVILLGCGAGAPFLIKLAQAARTDIRLGATLLVLLIPVTVVFMPLVVPRLVPAADVSAGPIALQLALTLLLPLVVGLSIRAKAARWAAVLQPVMRTASSIALVVLLVTTVASNLPAIAGLGLLALVAALLLLLGGFATGYVLARPGLGRRSVLGLGTAQRNIAAATLVASQDVADPQALMMVVLTSVVGIVVLFPIALRLRKPIVPAAAPPDDLAAAST